MKCKLLIIILITAGLAFSCGHTNNLAKYDIASKQIYFEEEVAPSASRVVITDEYDDDYDGKKKKESTADIVKDIALAASKGVLTAQLEEKLDKAADSREITNSISAGVESAMVKYLMIKPALVLGNSTEYITTIRLEECKIISTESGLYLKVNAKCTIIHRPSAGLVWEDSESESVRLRVNPGSTSKKDDDAAKTISVITGQINMASLSEEEIRSAILDAAKEVGREIGNTLRDDVREMKSGS